MPRVCSLLFLGFKILGMGLYLRHAAVRVCSDSRSFAHDAKSCEAYVNRIVSGRRLHQTHVRRDVYQPCCLEDWTGEAHQCGRRSLEGLPQHSPHNPKMWGSVSSLCSQYTPNFPYGTLTPKPYFQKLRCQCFYHQVRREASGLNRISVRMSFGLGERWETERTKSSSKP